MNDQAQVADAPTGDPISGGTSRGLVRLAKVIGLLLVAAAGYLALAPSPIDPVIYDPPPAPPLTGDYAPNDKLRQAEILAAGKIQGPEDVDVDAEGRVYGGTKDGRIVRILADGTVEDFATTGGRPLGLDFDSQGNLVVADALKGLLQINPQGEITVLVAAEGDVELGFTDDVDVARDGRIYFSDASSKFGEGEYMYDLLEGRAHGRLLRYDPQTKNTETLMDDLYFANGVALSQREDFVLVNETYRYRITRLWLTGAKAGTSDVFVDNLPGFPDGVSANGQGTFWVGLFTVRNPTADALASRPWAKKLLSKLPQALFPKPVPYGFVLGLNERGEVIHNLQDPTGKHLFEITSIEEWGGVLYLGSLHNDRVGKLSLTAADVK